MMRILLIALLLVATVVLAAPIPQQAPTGPLDFTMKDISGNDVALSGYRGKVVVMVNVASRCGFTPQYRQLQALADKYAKQGLVILGFPANNFGGQEPGTDGEIAQFCSTTFHVTFDLFSKISVKGDDIAPLYRYLTSKETNPQFGGEIAWNFTKFLIDRDGHVVNRFASNVAPDAPAMVTAIEQALARPATPQAPTLSAKAVLPATVRVVRIVADDFWQTNCYLFIGERNETILVDPADDLELGDTKLLVDITTGKSRKASAGELARAVDGTVVDAKTGTKWLVYATWRATGRDAARIAQVIREQKLHVKYLVITHGHIDHIGAAGSLKKKTGAHIVMHAADLRGADGAKLLPAENTPLVGYPKDAYTLLGGLPKVDTVVKDGDLLTCGGMTFQILHTPGHSPGHIALATHMADHILLVGGDNLLYHTIGRTNFRDGSGDSALLLRTIREKYLTFPDNTVVLPGHYEATTVGEEKVQNLYLNGALFEVMPPQP
jgi:glutathione peroxidase